MGKVTIDLTRISDKQRRFMEAQARYVAYGGARGGGKSWAVRTKAKLLALNWKKIKILIVRRTYPELLNNHIEQLCAELAGLAKYSQVRKTLTFRNGSTIRFGYCATDRDILQYQGAEYDVVFIDEAAQLKKEWLDAIDATVRGTNGFPKRTYYTLNPGGQSHGYFKRLFIDRLFETDENRRTTRSSRRLSPTTRRSWRRSRNICRRCKSCRESCGRHGLRADGTSTRGSSSRIS